MTGTKKKVQISEKNGIVPHIIIVSAPADATIII